MEIPDPKVVKKSQVRKWRPNDYCGYLWHIKFRGKAKAECIKSGHLQNETNCFDERNAHNQWKKHAICLLSFHHLGQHVADGIMHSFGLHAGSPERQSKIAQVLCYGQSWEGRKAVSAIARPATAVKWSIRDRETERQKERERERERKRRDTDRQREREKEQEKQ